MPYGKLALTHFDFRTAVQRDDMRALERSAEHFALHVLSNEQPAERVSLPHPLHFRQCETHGANTPLAIIRFSSSSASARYFRLLFGLGFSATAAKLFGRARDAGPCR